MTKRHHIHGSLLLGLVLLLSAASVQAAGALLWKVETERGAVSYLFGTIHIDDPRVTALPEPVKNSIDSAKIVVLEMKLTPELQVLMAQAVMLPPEQKLSDLLPADLYHSVLGAMGKRGYPDEVTARLQPWAITMTLSMPPPRTGEFLDKQIYDRALTDGKQVMGLETAEEQLAIFRDLTLADQQSLLRVTLKDIEKMPEMMETMTRAWLQRDMDKLIAMNEESISELPQSLQRRFGRRLLETRNHRMAERALPILQEGGAFIAVGALHLAGDEGLVALLREKGIKVTPVY